jgi:hypothetical protein
MAADTKELIIELTLQNKQLIKDVQETNSKFDKLNKETKKSQGFISTLKLKFIAFAGAVVGVGAAFTKAIGKASDFEEANAKFGTVFRGVSKEANAMRQELVNSYGLSTLASTKFLSSTQDLFVPLGIARDKAADLSGETVKLARDIASFNNLPTEQVLMDIQSALVGNFETTKKYGVVLNETTIKQRAMEKGIKLTNGTVDAQNKALIALELITKGSADAVGDFERTQDSFANTLKRIQAIAEDVTTVIGQELLKAVGPTVKEFGAFIQTREGMELIAKTVRGIVTGFLTLFAIIKTVTNSLEIFVQSTIGGLKIVGAAVSVFKNGFKAAGKDIRAEFQALKEQNAVDAQDITNIWQSTSAKLVEIWKEPIDLQIEGTQQIVQATEESNAAVVENNVLTKELLKETNDLFRESEREAEDQTLQEKIERIDVLLQKVKEGSEQEKKLIQAKTIFEKKLEEQRKKELTAFFKFKEFLAREDVSATRDALDDIATLTQSKNRTLFKIGKGVAMANATIDAAQAILKTMASVPFPANLPLVALQTAAGIVQIDKISNTKFVGKRRGGVIDNVMGSPINGEDGIIGVQRGEGILDRETTVNLGRNTIDMLNATKGKSGLGQRPNLIVNVYNNRPEEVVNVINDYGRQYGFTDNGTPL